MNQPPQGPPPGSPQWTPPPPVLGSQSQQPIVFAAQKGIEDESPGRLWLQIILGIGIGIVALLGIVFVLVKVT